jgi:tripartite ATP-independent transporter DctM subunit
MSEEENTAGEGYAGPGGTAGWVRIPENAILAVSLLLMALIPVVEFFGRRWLGFGIPGAADYVRHLTLWIAFLGAAAATRDDRHLQIVATLDWVPASVRPWVHFFRALFAALVCLALCAAAVELVVSEAPGLPEGFASVIPGPVRAWLEPFGLFDAGNTYRIGGWLPVWAAEAVMAVGFLVMAVRFAFRARLHLPARLLILPLSLGAVVLLGLPEELTGGMVLAGFVVTLAAAVLGAPIFTLLGAAALLLFRGYGVTIAAIPAETYRIVASPILPTIPIFTLVGLLLAEGRSSERLVRFFRAIFGSVPGGTAVAATLLCAFFTTFTGASGVTILALGGLLLPVLVTNGFSERFSLGLLTSTGSLGLLLPPSLVVILYGVVANVPITDMFKAGIIPGLLLILPFCLISVWEGRRRKAQRTRFESREALSAFWEAKWEVFVPVLALVLIFGGFCTLVEAAAMLVFYAILVVTVVHRDVSFRGLASVFVRCAILVGGVLIILGVAMGLTSYLVDAQVPMQAAGWAGEHLQSKWVFLLALNGALILTGCLMDIYSALVVVVPLILPIATRFGVDPVHLGIIFLTNLQLGYLTPPVGMNLFLASFTFNKPLTRIARDVIPFLLVLAGVVLLVTYVPWLSMVLLK